tara:strand:+ start:461 stop:649 length:189 start_codon:yes stop_codon:yes gene_type:complete
MNLKELDKIKALLAAMGVSMKDIDTAEKIKKLQHLVKDKNAYGGKIKKTYAMGGGMRKANYK